MAAINLQTTDVKVVIIKTISLRHR